MNFDGALPNILMKTNSSSSVIYLESRVLAPGHVWQWHMECCHPNYGHPCHCFVVAISRGTTRSVAVSIKRLEDIRICLQKTLGSNTLHNRPSEACTNHIDGVSQAWLCAMIFW